MELANLFVLLSDNCFNFYHFKKIQITLNFYSKTKKKNESD